MSKYTLQYRTFDQLLNDVRVDLQNVALEQMIEPQQLIKVVRRVSYDLGLKIFMTKEAVLEVERFKVRLPDDFYVLNFALICGQFTVTVPLSQGTHIEERKIGPTYQCQPATIDTCTDPVVNTPCDPCTPVDPCIDPCANAQPCQPCQTPKVCLNCKGECFELVQIIKTQTRTFRELFPLRIIDNPVTVDCDCPNTRWHCRDEAWIKDGWLFTNFECGNVYINYQGNLQDDDGNLLAPDHPLLNEYYEYATKERIFENMWFNDEDVARKLELTQAKLKMARNNALSMVNTPDFSEMRKVWEKNRKAQYSKYFQMFASYGPIHSRYR